MDLWSKGLGRLVLTLRLSDRAGIEIEGTDMVMKGTMGQPTYWDWAVNLDEEDVVDFLVFLQQPSPVRYMVKSDQRWVMLKTALQGAIIFALRTAGLILFGPRPVSSAIAAPSADASLPAGSPVDSRDRAASEEKQ